jgi:hypothetical protein
MQPPPDARRCTRPRQSAKRSTVPVVHRFFDLMLSFLSRGSFQRPGFCVPFLTGPKGGRKKSPHGHTPTVFASTGWLAVVPFGFGTNPPSRPQHQAPEHPCSHASTLICTAARVAAPRTVWMNLHRRHRDDAYCRGMTFGPASAFPVHLFLSNGIKPNVESHSWTRNAVTHSLTTGTAALFHQRRRPWGCGRTTLWCPLFDRPKRVRKKPPDSTRCG